MRDIFQAFAKAGIGSGLNLALGLIRNKVMALALGPQGMGFLALLQQINATALPIATVGGETPIVQGLASRKEEARDKFLASATLTLLFSCFMCMIIFIEILPRWSSNFLSGEILLSPTTLRAMALPLLFSALGTLFLSLLTSIGAIGTLQKSQLIGNFFGLIAALPLAYFWQNQKTHLLALYLMASPLCILAAAVYFTIRLPSSRELLKNLSFKNAKLTELKSYLQFGGTTLTTGFIVTATWLSIRAQIARTFSPDTLGFFSAVVSLSGLSISLFNTALASFYMPKFASASDAERPFILRTVLKFIIPLAFAVFLILACFPEFILKILYSNKFMPASSLLIWWAAGDLFRTVSHVFSHAIIAGKNLRFTLFSETFFSLLLLASVSFSLRRGGNIVSIGVSYFSVYSLFLFSVLFFCKKKNYY